MEAIIILIIIGIALYLAKKKKPSKKRNTATQNQTSITNSITTYKNYSLTIHIEESIKDKFQAIISKIPEIGMYQGVEELLPIVARYNVTCQEVDDYINEFRPIFLSKIESQKQASEEWEQASELDREDMLQEFKEIAIQELDIKPNCDLTVLFSVADIDLTVDDALIDAYGFPIITLYFSKRLGTYIIPSDHYERKNYESLVDAGLAVRGDDVPIEYVIEKLTLKELSALVSDLAPPKLTRKAKAIEYLLHEVPDIKERINRAVSLRSVFMIIPLPDKFRNIDVQQVESSWAYAREFTLLICRTYSSMSYRNRELERYLDPDYGYSKFTIEDAEECCPYCKRIAKKKYSLGDLPTVPLHVGCSCHISAE